MAESTGHVPRDVPDRVTEPMPLLAGAAAVGDRIAVLPSLLHLMWPGIGRGCVHVLACGVADPSELVAGMSSEQLRQTIVRATMPLIGEYDTLTMARIAQAAGIGEADLLAVFADKEAVIQACMSKLMAHVSAVSDPAGEVSKLDAIRVDQPLASRLLEVIDILGAYYHRVRAGLEAFEQAGFAGDGTGIEPSTRSFSRNDFRVLGGLPEIRRAVAKLLKPDEQRLRLSAEALAEVFLGMSRFCTRAPNEEQPLPAEQVVNLFLHGALITE